MTFLRKHLLQRVPSAVRLLTDVSIHGLQYISTTTLCESQREFYLDQYSYFLMG